MTQFIRIQDLFLEYDLLIKLYLYTKKLIAHHKMKN